MAKPKIRRIVPHDQGGWEVTTPGKRRALSVHRTQAEAIRTAVADFKPLGTLVIHGRDGQIRLERHYPRQQAFFQKAATRPHRRSPTRVRGPRDPEAKHDPAAAERFMDQHARLFKKLADL